MKYLLTRRLVPELRRSSRSTRGQHSRFSRDNEILLVTPIMPTKPNNQVTNLLPHDTIEEVTEEPSETVNCACGKIYENDEQMMAQCEKCDKWQHVKCLFGAEDETFLPETYYCHVCEPSLYPKSLTTAVSDSAAIATNTSTTLEVPPVTAGEQDTLLSSHNINAENSPVEVDESYSPPGKKRKINPVSVSRQFYFFFLMK